jgi:hypothetical protein
VRSRAENPKPDLARGVAPQDGAILHENHFDAGAGRRDGTAGATQTTTDNDQIGFEPKRADFALTNGRSNVH